MNFDDHRIARPISIAYSPDTDDQFMIAPLKSRAIDWGEFEFEFIVGDIQELNAKARDGLYDITAISIGAYPFLQDIYNLIPVGASVGDRFGPAIVTAVDARLALTDLKGLRVAVPGLNTTAHLAAQDLFGPFVAEPMHFLSIPAAVKCRDVDAGLLIHEMQLEPERHGLRSLGNLGTLWWERYALPLPLGGNAIRRSLGSEAIQKLTALYRASIEYALNRREVTINDAIKQAAAREILDPALGDRYISMYVNERSLDFQSDTIQGIKTLYQVGRRSCDLPIVDLDDCLVRL